MFLTLLFCLVLCIWDHVKLTYKLFDWQQKHFAAGGISILRSSLFHCPFQVFVCLLSCKVVALCSLFLKLCSYLKASSLHLTQLAFFLFPFFSFASSWWYINVPFFLLFHIHIAWLGICMYIWVGVGVGCLLTVRITFQNGSQCFNMVFTSAVFKWESKLKEPQSEIAHWRHLLKT